MYSPEIFDHKKLLVRYGQSETYITQDYVYNYSKKRGQSNKQIAIDLKISISTVKRVWMYYLDTGEKLLLKNGVRRMKEIKDYEEKIVIRAYKDQRVGARRLEKILDQDYGIHIPHNRIYRILLKNNMANENEKKKKPRKKWIRYERKHSLSLLHLDWHTSEYNGKEVCVVMDDESRKILTVGEFENEKQEHVIKLMDNVLKEYSHIMEIREILTDRGSQFYANKRDKNNEANNNFEKYIKEKVTMHIVSRPHHPSETMENWRNGLICMKGIDGISTHMKNLWTDIIKGDIMKA